MSARPACGDRVHAGGGAVGVLSKGLRKASDSRTRGVRHSGLPQGSSSELLFM